MCGIVGYIGKQQAAPVILEGLAKLEYRGYDSAGMAVFDGEKIQITKAVGRLKVLEELTHAGATMPGTVGIGHTRWATHGAPSDVNSHPHYNEQGTIAVVHNGIIENYLPLKAKLESKGYHFVSDTDTEVVAHLIDYYYKGNPLEAILKVMHRVQGSYALGIMFAEHPDEIFAVRKDSPLIVGQNEDGCFIASDVPAILKYTRKVYFIENQEIVRLRADGMQFYTIDEEEITKEPVTIEWDADAAEKGGYEYFMLKEMYEQPKTVTDTLMPRIKDGDIVIDELNMSDEEIKAIRKIFIVACGSAYHTGVTAKYVIEGLARIPVEVDVASEFRYRNPILEEGTMVIVISQSGETADTLAALRESQKLGHKVLGIVNVVGSSIAREADNVMYTWAGPEIAVASTKAYTTQIAALFALIGRMAVVRGAFNEEQEKSFVDALMQAPDAIQKVLDRKEEMHHIARGLLEAKDAFMLGRGLDYAILLEGALKLKEVSYIHTEAYASGELKHGTIALITEKTPVVALVTQERVRDKELSNIREVQSRGASVVILVKDGIDLADADYTHVFTLPAMDDVAMAFPASAALQLLAYYVSMDRGLDVDKPRNLAKVVTVE